EAAHLAVELHPAAVEVGGEHGRLAGAHLLKLDLLEVGVDVGPVDGDDRHDRVAGLDPLADLHLTLGDDAGDGGAQHGALKGQLGDRQPGLGGGDIGVLVGGDAGDVGG